MRLARRQRASESLLGLASALRRPKPDTILGKMRQGWYLVVRKRQNLSGNCLRRLPSNRSLSYHSTQGRFRKSPPRSGLIAGACEQIPGDQLEAFGAAWKFLVQPQHEDVRALAVALVRAGDRADVPGPKCDHVRVYHRQLDEIDTNPLRTLRRANLDGHANAARDCGQRAQPFSGGQSVDADQRHSV